MPTNAEGAVIGPDREPLPTNAAGVPVNNRGEPLPTDISGRVIYPAKGLDAKLGPTDKSGRPVYPVIGPDGQLLPTNDDDVVIGPDGKPLPTNAAGLPVNNRGKPLPTDANGNAIYPKEGLDAVVLPTDRSGKPIHPVIGPDGEPLPTDQSGVAIAPDGHLIPTNAAGAPVNNRGEPLPTDADGYAIYPARGMDGELLPTDINGRPVHEVIGPNGKLMPTNAEGAVIGPDREPLPTNAAGVPVNNRGEPLPTDISGRVIYPAKGLDAKLGPTDKSGRPVYPVIGPDGQLLPTNDDDVVIGPDGKPLPTNAAGLPVNNRGKPLPTDANGNAIYPKEGLDAVVLPTDRSGKPIHPVIGPDGEPLPTDQSGVAIAPDGHLIPTNAAGAPVNNRGEPLPTDADGYAIYPARGMDGELLPTDINGRPVHEVIGPDGKLLPTDSDGSVVGPDGKPIPTNAAGMPINNQGDRLPTDTSGTVIYPANGLDAGLSPTDESGRPVYSVIGLDGQPLATDQYHAILGPDGEPIPTNAAGVPINNKGELLPTDSTGHIIFPIGGLDAGPLPTNKEGKQIHPVIGPDGIPLPTNSDGSPVAPDGEVIPTNNAGWPVDNEGHPMPTDVYGNVIYPVRLPDGSPLPTDKRGKPVYPVIGPDGQPLPTGESGGILGIDGQPIPTNAAGKPIGEDSSPLPTDEYGRVVQLPAEEATTSFATDEYGHVIHPVVDSDGFPLHRDENGAYVSKDGKTVELNDQDLPVGPDGKVLPTDSYGNYIYPDVDDTGRPLPTDSSGRSIYTVIGPDGEPFPTMSNGSILAPDGRIIPTSASGKPLGPDSSPLPTDARGRILYPKEPLFSTSKPTDASGRVISPVVDRHGRPLTTDESGQFLGYDGRPLETDVDGRPLDNYGRVLPTDDNGNYVYDTGKPVLTDLSGKPVYKVVDLKGEPLPTNADGFFVKEDGQILPTDRSGAPMKTDGSTLPTDSEGNFLWPGEAMEAAPAEKPYLIVTEEGETLPKDNYGRYLDPNGDPVRVNENGKPIRPNSEVMPTNAEGNYVLLKADYVVRATAAKPTEFLVIGPDGNLLPTDSEGAVLAPDGQPIPTAEDGTPLSEKGLPLPTDKDGKFVFQKAARSSITPVEGVFGPDGELLPTDESGNYLSLDGRKIERDDEGKPLGPDGRILPTDEYGGYIYPVTGPDGAPLPTDKNHRPIYIVVGPDGVPLPTDKSGVAVGPNGQPIPTNRAGRPLNAAGAVLPTDSLGHVVFSTPKSDCETKLGVMDVVIAINTESVDSEGFTHIKRVIRDLIDEYFDLAPDMTQIAVIKYSGTAEVPITLGGYNEKIELLNELSMMQRDETKETSKLNVGVNAAQQQFITFGRGSAGKLLIVFTDGRDIYATDAIRPLQEANIPLLVIGKTEFEEEIKDNADLYIMVDEWPQLRAAMIANKIEEECVAGHIPIPLLRITGRPRPAITPSTKPVIAVGPDGQPLPTDQYGSIIGGDGKPIPTDVQGKPVGPDGSPLPTDEQGNVMVAFEPTTTAAATDEYGHIIYPIKDLDGQPLPTDETGSSVNRLGERVEFDEIGKPVGPDRMPLPTDETGSFIYPAIDNSGRPLPTDENKRPLYRMVDANGQPLPTDEGGTVVDSEGSPIPTNAAGRPISPNGSPFPFDEDGNVVISEGRPTAEIQFPTDSSGHILYPIVWPDDSSLPTDDSGSYVDNFGRLVEIGDDGKPLDPSGQPLPTNAAGAFVFPQLGKDGNPLPTDENKRPIYPVVLPNGQPLPTDVSGFPLADDGRPFPTDNAGRPLSIRGEILPTNEDGNVVYSPKASATVAYPVIGPDGEPLPTDESGAVVDEYGIPLPIEVDKDGRPLGPGGVVLPTSAEGHYVYIPSEPARTLKPADTGTSIVATTITKQDVLPEEVVCEKIDTPSNIIFVVESSEAVRKQHAEMKTLLLDFVENSMDLSKSNAGVIAYGGSVDISVDIGNYQNFDELAESVREIPIIGGGSSGDEHAMKTALQLFREVYNDGIGEIILHLHKTPSSHEAKTFIRHLKANETIALFDIGKGRWNRLRKADSASTSLRNQICTYLEQRKISQIRKLEGVKTTTASPTDEIGRIFYPVIGPDGQPLPTNSLGEPVDAFGKPISKDGYGRPLGADGRILPTNKDGAYMYPAIGPDGQPLPTDVNKKPVYPVIGADGQPLPTDETGAVVGPDGKPIPTDTSGRPVDVNGSPLPTDPSGKVIFIETTEAVKTLPTDEAGRVIRPIIGPDGEPLPTDRTGRPIGAFGRPVPKDKFGRPLGPDRKVLPTDDDGNYVYPAVGRDGRPLPTDINKKPVYPVIGPDGRPLPTDETGAVVGPDGKPIPTDPSGRPVDANGSPLPTDPSGKVHVVGTTKAVKILPTDKSGRLIRPIVGPDREPLPTDKTGKSIGAFGRPVPRDKYGRPLGPDRRVLPMDDDGNYIYPAIGPDGRPLPTDINNKPVYPVIGPDGRPLPTDETGAVVGPDGQPIPTDTSGRPVDVNGSPLPTDHSGKAIFIETTEVLKTLPTDEAGRVIRPIIGHDGEPLPTDRTGRPIGAFGRPVPKDRYGRPLGPDRKVLPTDDDGNYVYPALGPDSRPLPTDANKRPVYPVVDGDGRQLPTDETGAVVGHDGKPIPTDSSGRPVGADGSPLPTDSSGNIILTEGTEAVKTLPTDETGRIIYPIIGPDREPLPTDSSGKSVDASGRRISEDPYGRPLGPDGRVLPTDSDGNYVYPAVGPDGQPLPTDANKRPVYPVVDADGRPLPTDETGAVVGDDGKPIPTDSWGRPIDVHGFPLPSDPSGNVVYSKAAVSDYEQGQQTLYPVTRPDGEPLSTSLYGHSVDALGMLVSTDASGKPLGPDGKVLPTDASGKFVYPAFGADTRPVSTSSYKKPVHFVVNAEGVILPTDDRGAFLDSSGQPIPTDSSGRPIGADGSQLPTDHLGNVIYLEATKGEKTLPTDSSGHVIFPVLGPDGQLLPTDESGVFVDAYGRPIPTDEMRRPVDSEKKVLPTDSEGNYIRPALGFDGRLLPTDANKIPLYPIVDVDGMVLPTDDTGVAVDRHGKHLPTDASGIPLGRDGQPLPTDSSGRFVLKDSETIGTTSAGAVPVVYAVTGPDGEPLPTDLSGSPVDLRGISTPTNKSGYPLGPGGSLLPTDTSEKYLYPLLGPDGSPLPTDIHRRPVYPVVGPDGHLLPTDESGTVVGPDGRPLPTDSLGRPVAADGSILPSDSSGRILFSEGTERAITLPTDENGDVIYHVTGPDGEPLSTSYFPESPRSTLPYVILMPDGNPLPTDSSNNYIDENGVPISVDEQGRPLDARGQPLNKDAAGNYLYFAIVRDKSHKPTLPTRKYDIVNENGFPLPTDFNGHFLDENALPIPTDAQGYPINDAEHTFERNQYGHYVYKPKTTTKDLLEEVAPMTTASFTTSKKSPYCTVNSNVDVLLLLDASANVRVVDYRIMKEFIENFLTDHFNLRKNRVRVGVLKYGDKVEVPLALGDYDNQAQLISKISETRRMRGSAHLSAALRDAAGEFLISGSTQTPKVVIVLSNGKSSDDPRGNARVLREDVGAIVYLIDAGGQGDPEQNLAVVGESNPHRIVSLNEWRGSDSETIGAIADELCELLPQLDDSDTEHTWPSRKTTLESERTTPARICTRIDYQADVMFVLDSSDNFSPEQYGHLKEGLSTLIDETFDLSPDVVQVGFVEYSDKASVPVALGHYEDKVQLLTDIANSEQLFGEAIVLKGLNAARQQFQLHGRKNVPRVLLLITNGVNRGNAANAAEDLRERYNVELFILAVNASADAMRTLNRLAGEHLAHQKVIPLIGADKLHGSELAYVGRTLCGLVEPAAATIQPHFTDEYATHKTTKRDVSKFIEAKRTDEEQFAITPARLPSRTTRAFEPTPLCKDGYLRPYQLSIVVDATARSTEKDLQLVLAHIANFVETRFSSDSGRMQLNLVAVDSNNVTLREPNFGVDVIEEKFKLVKQTKGDELSAKLGRGIDEAVMLATEHAIKGVNQIILIVSADGTSSDDAIPSAEFARGHYQHSIIAVSIRTPASELLKELAEGSPTRVIHFSEWSIGSELFGSWLAHAICDYVTASTTKKIGAPYVTSSPTRRTTTKIKITEPANVEATPLSPNSFSVSWTCCTNKKADYVILYTPDASLPKWQWQRVAAKCRDSFGKRIEKLPTDNEYTICVETRTDAANRSAPLNLANCDTVQLNKDTTPPPDYEAVDEHTAPCQCVCTERGEAVVQPTCADVVDPFRPLTTLPPAIEGECPCKVAAHSGRCPSGYFFSRGYCYDVNECQQQNGGCSHGCVNTPGDFYCACPHGMMRDPVNPKNCINVAGSFDRIAELLGQYLSANREGIRDQTAKPVGKGKPTRYKATVKSADDRTISFEWSSMPAVVRRALKWLF
uniref:Mesocentin n=1 Tax=Ascaris suum TaxID=6253 RepID=F1KPH3_ASCSU